MFYNFIRGLAFCLAKFFFRVKVVGDENQDYPENYLICSNHISLWDPVIVLGIIRKNINFMAKIELFKLPVVGWVLKKVGAFPVERNGSDFSALKKAISIISEGGVLGVFPQGKRCRGTDPRETSVKGGVGMLAANTKVALLPVAIVSKDNKIRLFRKVTVVIGKPIPFDIFGEEKNKAQYIKISETVFGEICSLYEKETEKMVK